MGLKKIYLSGPITKGDRDHNFRQAAVAQRTLLREGFAVLNPMLSMKLPGCWEIPHEVWVASDLPWVACACAVLRLPGESKGAEIECKFADGRGIPVFDDMTVLIEHFMEESDGNSI